MAGPCPRSEHESGLNIVPLQGVPVSTAIEWMTRSKRLLVVGGALPDLSAYRFETPVDSRAFEVRRAPEERAAENDSQSLEQRHDEAVRIRDEIERIFVVSNRSAL